MTTTMPAPGSPVVYKDPERQALARRTARRNALVGMGSLIGFTLVVVGHAVLRGWWAPAAWTLLFDVVLNGYPVLLQRYNRALLARL